MKLRLRRGLRSDTRERNILLFRQRRAVLLLVKSQLPECLGGLSADVGIVAGGCQAQVLFGGGAIAPGSEEESGVDVRDSEIRAQADGFQEFAEGFGAIPGLLEEAAFDVVGFGRFRVCLDGGIDLLPRFVQPLQGGQRNGIVCADLGIVRLELDRPGEVEGGLGGIAARGQKVSQISQRIGRIGI